MKRTYVEIICLANAIWREPEFRSVVAIVIVGLIVWII